MVKLTADGISQVIFRNSIGYKIFCSILRPPYFVQMRLAGKLSPVKRNPMPRLHSVTSYYLTYPACKPLGKKFILHIEE